MEGRPIIAMGRAVWLAMALVLSACAQSSEAPSSGAPPPAENVGEARSAAFVNGDFETGNASAAPPGWTVSPYLNPGVTITSPQTRSGLNLATGGSALTYTLATTVGPETQTDPSLGTGASFRWPKYGNKVAIVNQLGKNQNTNSLKQTMTIAAGDVDSVDGLPHVRFVVAPVLENPGHTLAQQPYYFVQLTNLTRSLVLYNEYYAAAQAGVPWKVSNGYYYTDWQLVDISPGSATLAVGDQVELEVIGAGCSLGGHFGHIYVDSVGAIVPGPFVTATGPATANAGSNITYKLSYKNGGTGGVGNATVEFNVPTNTTFVSVNAPGLTCTTPAVGATGLVSCVIGTLAPGASGNFTVTVKIGTTATGTITAGNYDIYGTAVTPLLGPKVNTTITSNVSYADLGVSITNGASSLVWGQPVTYTVVAQNQGPSAVTGATVSDPVPTNLTGVTWTCTGTGGGTCAASGSGAINDNTVGLPVGAKVTYTVNGTVASGSGSGTLKNIVTITAPAGVSDPTPSDNSAGDNDTILSPNGVTCATNTDCVSGVCDADKKCGYSSGSGPCTSANAATVCRSGVCGGSSAVCVPASGCAVDGDCTAGNWCQTTTFTCVAKLPNGTAIPTVAGHTPPLTGACTAAAGTAVCSAAVCDTGDNRCGYTNGAGACTQANAGTVCRSGVCDPDGKCGYANGAGACNPTNATTVCRSGVCDPDGKCGLSNGVGACNAATAATVCRSAVCDPDGKCGLTNGVGTCTTANGATICRSTVCDPADAKCGLATGDGPCTAANAANVCRSGECSQNGTCKPAGGCNVDGDCTGGNWCNISARVCQPKIANGVALPTDSGHASPALNGVCSTAAATLVCQSGVCDPTDNRCGYGNGAGTCTAANAGTVCRSGACGGSSGVCVPAGGCTTDGDCAATQWCQTPSLTCVPKLPNGTAIPPVAGHAPALTGACTTAAATAVCAAGVCDPSDNRCGLTNGAGACTQANAATVCRSGVCDPDGKCGLTNGVGACTAANAATVCRSGACDPDGKCGLTNGVGACTTANAAVVCRSGVCDPADASCGLANGDGPCSAATASFACRSGECSQNGTCKPAGGCNVDSDCASGNWCDISAHTCMPKIANGGALPTDSAHTAPTLNGICSTAAATLVCVSGVCDPNDNRCGLATGDGPCTAASAPTACRSGACGGSSGVCVPPGGCTIDGDCAGSEWCQTTTLTCLPKLPNGQAIPSVAGHAPPLTGTCTVPVAAAVCASNVCDTNDNRCGYANGAGACTAATAPFVCRSGVCDPDGKCGYDNGDGPCTAANAGTVCRSGVCDPDGNCGYANGSGACTVANAATVCRSGTCDPADGKCGLADGDGPCTASTGGLVCRSGECSQNGTCKPSGGCNVDTDCASIEWCNISAHACVLKVANGGLLPTDAGHATPTLDGVCSPAAAALVCVSGVCDPTDNRCGYANGDGPCTTGNAVAVCRSGVCGGSSGVCVPAGGCSVDGECPSTHWCQTPAFTCVPKLPNGQPIPTVAGHTPALTGACTAPAATAVCTSSVCDLADDGCGYANGDGACTAANAGVVCRSGVCDPDGKCGYANGDGICTAATAATVCRSGVCDPDNKCGYANGDGSCSEENAGVVCRSSVCDPLDGKCGYANSQGACTAVNAATVCRSGACDPVDAKCGYANGDGPCTAQSAGTVCRSGECSADATCKPASGCNVDADCASGNWCNISAHTCLPQLANGGSMPTDTGHVSPTLNGVCGAAAATLVCVSGVCDPKDDSCGLASGDGPCTAANAAVVCRSGACGGSSGVCVPSGGCTADGDCAAGNWCQTPSLTCLPKLPNGQPIPTVAGHTPALTGACTAPAGAAVCAAGVCDPADDSCGYANGDGACTAANAGVVCRSGVCDPDGKCGYANGDGTCTAANAETVCRSGVCDPDGKCGYANGDGACTAANAAVVCRANVCDADGKCGLANGAGACTAATAAVVCRSATCDADGLCGYANGDGPCTAATAAVVCRSGECSQNGTCAPAGGCNVDADCAGAWCDISAHACQPKIANGGALPTDTGHTVPTLNGACSAAASALVCVSGVCDALDDRCGYANGDGACNAANAAVVCRSGVCDADGKCGLSNGVGACNAANGGLVCRSGSCDPDGKCGLTNGVGTCTVATAAAVCRSGVCDPSDGRCGLVDGDGPCTAATAGLVCRSGECSGDGTCKPAGGCNVDGDCPGAWCNISAHACQPKIANGGALPTDLVHASPVLNGVCSATAGALVCQSGICDPKDNICGLATGDGPCTQATGPSVCRSGVCGGSSGICVPPGGCAVDADCTAGNWCQTPTLTCVPKLPNGQSIPSVAGHTPVLAGACNTAAAAVVCQSGVCDAADDKCGYENGDGSCTAANAATVCRSGVCDPDGKCGLSNGAGACTVANGATICRSGVCDLDNKCGLANGDGACTAANAATVCRSGVCDPDGKCGLSNGVGDCSPATAAVVCRSGVCDAADARCGLADGDGPCTTGNAGLVCRSGDCSANGTCKPVTGCNADADCTGGRWCNIALHVCTVKIANGGAMPTDGAHATPTLNGACNAAAATLVCVSGVCDTADDKCGFANGDGACTAQSAATVCRSSVCDPDGKCGLANGVGPCTTGNAPVVCRSSACSVNGGVCQPQGGCAVDGDCGASEWCNTATFACTPKLPNGTAIPTVAGHAPPLTGACNTAAAVATCASGVCDPADDKCGYADGDGPCTSASAVAVCRSGSCSATGTCKAASACQVDADCTAAELCDTAAHLCIVKKLNGEAMPVIAGHQPVLDGICATAAATVACQSGVCDTADDKCGYANGVGPCTTVNAGQVCRSSTCSPNAGVCIPSSIGCAVDADCDAGAWCNTALFVCAPKLLNGDAIPTVAGHTPALTGTCSAAVGATVCQSGVCDTTDDKCGYANGDGPCTATNALQVCRTGTCSTTGVCENPGDCLADSDCNAATQYCNTAINVCAPKLPNGAPLPVVTPHQPALDGTCSDTAAAIVCQSGVCDATDNACGHAIGEGPCTAANGAEVCRSTVCAVSGPSQGTCVECVTSNDCTGGSLFFCDTAINACAQCTPAEPSACAGVTPVCAPGIDSCVPCGGDFGDTVENPCPTIGAPYCFLFGEGMGSCGKCTADEQCVGHAAGSTCDPVTGTCATVCHQDADCDASSWCTAPPGGNGACVPKLDNGMALPSSPSTVAKCTAEVGVRVCKSGVCDTADDKCGYENGDGPCDDGVVCRSGACDAKDKKCGFANGNGPCDDGAVCRSGACDTKDQTCGLLPGDGPCDSDAVCRAGECDKAKNVCAVESITGCQADADCPSGQYCGKDGACAAKLPVGVACTSENQCQSGACTDNKCDGFIPAGDGVFCAARPGSSPDEGIGVVLLGLALATAGLARRRRR